MPELPEVEVTRLGILPYLQDQTIEKICVFESRLRWPVPADLSSRLQGHQIRDIRRRGKYLLLEAGEYILMIHLGMSGRLKLLKENTARVKHDHIDLYTRSGWILRYHDPRRFGAWLLTRQQDILTHPLLTHLGVEPLTDTFNADDVFQQTRSKKTAIKLWLMQATHVVGVGNIYANEALFLAKIHPQCPAGQLTKAQCKKLVTIVKQVLQQAIAQGGTTLKDFAAPSGHAGYFQQVLHVYGRGGKACTRCDAILQSMYLGQRSTVFCERCQVKIGLTLNR